MPKTKKAKGGDKPIKRLDQLEEPYSLKEFSALLDRHPQTIKYHIYESKAFAGVGRKVGHSLAFSDKHLARARVILAEMAAKEAIPF